MTKPFGADIPPSTSAGLRTVEVLDEASRVMQMQQAEIERLQMAVGLASTIRGEVSDWLADPLKMMQEVVMYVEWMRAETERQVQKGKRSALNLCSAVEVLLADHERVLALLDDVRDWIRSDVGSGIFGPLERIDAELEGEK